MQRRVVVVIVHVSKSEGDYFSPLRNHFRGIYDVLLNAHADLEVRFSVERCRRFGDTRSRTCELGTPSFLKGKTVCHWRILVRRMNEIKKFFVPANIARSSQRSKRNRWGIPVLVDKHEAMVEQLSFLLIYQYTPS